MTDYYQLIMGSDDDCFVPIFTKNWSSELSSHNLNYDLAAQLVEGNRLRPILMAWGYYLNSPVNNNNEIANYAVCVELIHKASILLDDLIDGDIARHGMQTFHKEFSNEEAILYAIYLMTNSLKKIERSNQYGLTLLLDTLHKMTLGGIKEIQQDNTMATLNTTQIKEIISLETTTLIENSFILGYVLAGNNKEIPQEIKTIGKYAGYCFQILNDLEPFVSIHKNQQYKGNHNYDANKNRKNIAIAYLYGACSKTEKRKLEQDDVDFNLIITLAKKYDIVSLVLEEAETYISKVYDAAHSLEKKQNNSNYFAAFYRFLQIMFTECYKKLDLDFKDTFFNYR